MGKTAPVMAEAFSEARKRASSATSSGSMRRRMAAWARKTFSTTSSGEIPRVRAWSWIWPSTRGVRT
jgi:hypothetical protein